MAVQILGKTFRDEKISYVGEAKYDVKWGNNDPIVSTKFCEAVVEVVVDSQKIELKFKKTIRMGIFKGRPLPPVGHPLHGIKVANYDLQREFDAFFDEEYPKFKEHCENELKRLRDAIK
jgi:hypothetical protein